MEEIRIYLSLWKNAPVILICFAFAALGIRTLVVHPEKMGLGLWLGLLLFGLGGIFMLWLILKERITGKPYYLVTDESVIMNSGLKAWEVRFADVERFFLAGKMIGIVYKNDREIQKMEDAGWLGRIGRRFNQRIGGSQEHLYVSSMTMKPQELCDLLNERVKKMRAGSKRPKA
jgi:hypothetical protein